MNSCHAIAGTSIALGLLFLLNCSPKDESATRSSSKDQTFFNTAAQGNLTEVAAGGLAVAKSANFDVKAFGQRIIKDHSKASGELSNLAVQKNFSLPSELDAAHQMGIDRLTTLSGAAFDQAFAEMMVTDHVKASSLFEEAAKGAADPDVRSFAQSSLEMLQDHLQMARHLQEKVGPPRAE